MKFRQLCWLILLVVVGIFILCFYRNRNNSDAQTGAFPYPEEIAPIPLNANDAASPTEKLKQVISLVKANKGIVYDSLEDSDGTPTQAGRPSGKETANRKEKEKEKCQVIDIAIVCAGYNSTRIAMTLIKSLLFYRSTALHLHLIVDKPAKFILSHLFDTWEISNLTTSYYLTDGMEKYISWIPNKHYSGIYGLMKLILPEILPVQLHQVIVLDTDIIFASDVAELWELFRYFNQDQAVGLVENQSDWYLGGIWKNYKAWPAIGRGFNTGVILMNLAKLRAIQWMDKWKTVTVRELPGMQTTALADQDIFNAVLKDYQQLLYTLPCVWNAQLSDHSKSRELCESTIGTSGFKIIHWNSPKKVQVKHRLGRYYKNDYLTFVAHDGNLLRRGVLACAPPSSPVQENEAVEIVDDTCYDFERLATLVFRTHLYFMEFSYTPGDFAETDVTLVAQLSFDRLQMLEPLCQHWNGPISLALYMTDAEAQQFADFVPDSEILSSRRNVAYHLVYKDGNVYPVNYLRNVALSNVQTPFVFLSDIDFLPAFDLYERLKTTLIAKYLQVLEKQDEKSSGSSQSDQFHPKALVVPAFETQRYRLTFPANKSELVHMVKDGEIIAFRSDVWPRGHQTTNYSLWMEAVDPYTVEWEPDYEPYIVVSRNVPEYDNRFGGFGWNKVSHLMMLAVKGYELVILPDVFIVHTPHAPSIDIAKFRSKSQYRRCLSQLKQEFVRDLAKIYGMKATKYLISP